MARRPAYQVDVVVLAPNADALLDTRRPWVGRQLLTQKIRDELVHTGIGEQRSPRVVRDQT